jgi:hypothetical protein
MEKNPLNDNDVDGNTLNLNLDNDRTVQDYDKVYNQYNLRHKDYIFKDFEDYLCTVFCEGDGYTCLDDDIPDAFDDWIQKLEIEDWLRYGTIYGSIKQGEKV